MSPPPEPAVAASVESIRRVRAVETEIDERRAAAAAGAAAERERWTREA